jgi:ATP-dependent DNA ligase
MLAMTGRPCDSPAHLFEVKWDGVRALAFVDGGESGYRLHSRHRQDLRPRYPELAGLAALPPGTVLDGELVVLRPDGRPDFPAALGRENARSEARIHKGVRSQPITLVVFDLLYERFEPLLDRPLQQRRDRLAALLGAHPVSRLQLSEGVVGQGLDLFAAIEQQQLEGMMMKRLDSRYRPGLRSDAWHKCKRSQRLLCAILGFEPDGERDFKSLILASDIGGELRCVGKVGTGLTAAMHARLRQLLLARVCARPLIDAGMSGRWIEPGLYCSVSFLEWTASGSLRGPVFLELIESQ